jgi:FtsZ-binding cell division protein ZapB
MSSMAKIFVVVNLVFGILCFGAGATLLGASDDYKTAFEKEVAAHKQTKQDNAAEVTRLELTATQATQKATSEVDRANVLQGRVEELTTKMNQAEATNQSLRSSNESFSRNLGELKDLIAANQAFLDKQSGESKTATEQMLAARTQWEKEVANRVGLEQQVSELNEQMATVSATKGDLERELNRANFHLGVYQKRYGPIVPPEGAAGIVNGVRGNLVGISVGTADKVKLGDIYSLSRGAQYVGRIIITNVDKNQSVGEFDDRFPGSGAPPQVNDKASPGGLD